MIRQQVPVEKRPRPCFFRVPDTKVANRMIRMMPIDLTPQNFPEPSHAWADKHLIDKDDQPIWDSPVHLSLDTLRKLLSGNRPGETR